MSIINLYLILLLYHIKNITGTSHKIYIRQKRQVKAPKKMKTESFHLGIVKQIKSRYYLNSTYVVVKV